MIDKGLSKEKLEVIQFSPLELFRSDLDNKYEESSIISAT